MTFAAHRWSAGIRDNTIGLPILAACRSLAEVRASGLWIFFSVCNQLQRVSPSGVPRLCYRVFLPLQAAYEVTGTRLRDAGPEVPISNFTLPVFVPNGELRLALASACLRLCDALHRPMTI